MDYKGNKTFVFIWKIKNLWISISRTISSPKFVVEALNKTQWRLELDPGEDYADEHLRCRLRREDDDDDGPESVDVNFEISMTSDGESPSENVRESRFSFERGDCFSCEDFALREGLFRKNYATLTFHCRMWTTLGTEFVGAAQCSARTLMANKMVSKFDWIVEGVSSIPVAPTKSIPLAQCPEDEEGPSLTMEMILKNGSYRLGGFKLNAKGIDDEKVLVVTSKISVLDARNEVVQRDVHNYPIRKGVNDQKWHIPFYITRQTLKEYSPEDVLALVWECRNTVIDVNEIKYPNRRSYEVRK